MARKNKFPTLAQETKITIERTKEYVLRFNKHEWQNKPLGTIDNGYRLDKIAEDTLSEQIEEYWIIID